MQVQQRTLVKYVSARAWAAAFRRYVLTYNGIASLGGQPVGTLLCIHTLRGHVVGFGFEHLQGWAIYGQHLTLYSCLEHLVICFHLQQTLLLGSQPWWATSWRLAVYSYWLRGGYTASVWLSSPAAFKTWAIGNSQHFILYSCLEHYYEHWSIIGMLSAYYGEGIWSASEYLFTLRNSAGSAWTIGDVEKGNLTSDTMCMWLLSYIHCLTWNLLVRPLC